MSNLKLEERITVSAPPARVWKFLLDPARVAACLPGARLDGTEGENTFLGTMKVKVGPVLMEFKGKATMSEVVPDERRVTLTGTGNDKSGGGSAKMDMSSQVLAKDDGGSEIVVIADVALAGKLVRFGRGMMEGISKQLFKQFAERVRTDLESEKAAAIEEAPPEEPQKEAPAEARAAAEEAPEVKTAAESTAVDNPSLEEPKTEGEPAPAPAEPAAEQATAQAAPVQEPKAAPAEKEAVAPEKAAVVPADNAPLDAGSLVWAAIWAWIKGLFARIFGRKG